MKNEPKASCIKLKLVFFLIPGLGIRKLPGQNVSCNFGEGKTYYKVPPPNPVLEASESGFVWSVPVSCKENDIAWTKKGGGKSYHKWGGSKTVFGEGLYGMFSPPLSFPLPLVFLSRDVPTQIAGHPSHSVSKTKEEGALQKALSGTSQGSGIARRVGPCQEYPAPKTVSLGSFSCLRSIV